MEILEDLIYKNAISKLVEYLAKSERTEADCVAYLKRQKIPEDVIKKAVSEAKHRNWLSDERYTDLYTENAIICGRSPLEVRHKLIQKRINTETIDKAINRFFTPETTEKLIENQIELLLKRNSDLPPSKQFEKIATALYRKGFQYSDYEDILRKKLAADTV